MPSPDVIQLAAVEKAEEILRGCGQSEVHAGEEKVARNQDIRNKSGSEIYYSVNQRNYKGIILWT